MAAGDLTNKADVKAWLGINGTTTDTLLDRLVTSASAWISDQTSRSFSPTSVSRIRSGTGGQELMLTGPVSAVASLTIDAVTVPAQPSDGQPGYFLNGNLLCLSGYYFSRGRNNVRVTYTTGYSSVPADVAQACIELVASEYRRGPRPDVDSRSAQGQSHKWTTQDMPDSVRKVIARYSKVAPV